MVRTLALLAILVVLVYSAHAGAEETPLHIEKTEQLTESEYEMAIWWNPFAVDGVLWLIYEELLEDEQILKYRIYNGEWSSPLILADRGEFLGSVTEGESVTLFWNTQVQEESETVKSTCFKRLSDEGDTPVCSESESHAGDQFVVKTPDGEIWLLWSRIGFWEYQVLQEDHWSEKQVLLDTPGEYNRILEVVSREDDMWIFYEAGRSDVYSRVVTGGQISEPYPVATEGFPHLEGVTFVGTTPMVLLEVQEGDVGQKTLAYTTYDEGWTQLEAVATYKDGYLAGGSFYNLEDGKLLVFWSGTETVEQKPPLVDIYYRVYDGAWSRVYALTGTPTVWETSPTIAGYGDQLVIIWREKNMRLVFASYASFGEGGYGEPEELKQAAPKKEPEEPEKSSSLRWSTVKRYIEKYIILLPVGAVVGVLAVVAYLRREKREEVEKPRIGERRKEKEKKKRKR